MTPAKGDGCCRTCRYWQGLSAGQGRCKFNPPAMFLRKHAEGHEFWDQEQPCTSGLDWCGRYRFVSREPS